MNVSGNGKLEIEKRSEESLSYRHSGMSNDWQYNVASSSISSMGQVPSVNLMAVCGATVGPSCSSSSMVEAFGRTTWEHPVSATLPLGFSEMNVLSGVSTSDPLAILKAGLFSPNMAGFMPPSLSQFPADSSFIERAARLSSFSREHLVDTMNPFGVHQPTNPHLLDVSMELSSFKNATPVGVSENDHEEAEFSGGGAQEDGGPPSFKGLSSKKRKRIHHDADLEQEDNGVHQDSGDAVKNNTETQQEGEQNTTPTDNKSNGKHGKEVSQGSDPPKGDYIHVRARRGQATNSHSLAERVRREKISDRMKYLQDLVPGCSKVTGKAVMLDEIINYVQSLQRQVEFLSMKLATVNPSLDLNTAELLAKNHIFAAAAPSSGRGFSPHMPIGCPPLHLAQPPILKPGLPSIGNSSDVLMGTVSPQLANMGEGYKDPTEKMPNVWEDELHNIVQMASGAPLENQEQNHLS